MTGAALPERLRSLPPSVAQAAADQGDSDAVAALLQGAGPDLRDCVQRLHARGDNLPTLAAFCDRWDKLSERTRQHVARPFDGDIVTWGNTPARQFSQVACGYAVAAMLAAYANPRVGLWLAWGGGRFAELQDQIGARVRRAAVGPLRWPACFGTPPWTLARELDWPGVRFCAVAVDSPGRTSGASHRLAQQLALGVPAPLYVGGVLRDGIAKSVPRHVVLVVRAAGRTRIYEPSSARMFDVDIANLTHEDGPREEFGNWSTIHAIVFGLRR